MRESIADALRQHLDRQGQGRPAAELDAPIVANGMEIQGLSDLLAAINKGIAGSTSTHDEKSKSKDGNPGLEEYLKSFAKDRKTIEVPRDMVVASEEHSELKKAFQRRYEEEGEEDEKAGSGERTRDEL
jgi:hypothetical protein